MIFATNASFTLKQYLKGMSFWIDNKSWLLEDSEINRLLRVFLPAFIKSYATRPFLQTMVQRSCFPWCVFSCSHFLYPWYIWLLVWWCRLIPTIRTNDTYARYRASHYFSRVAIAISISQRSLLIDLHLVPKNRLPFDKRCGNIVINSIG